MPSKGMTTIIVLRMLLRIVLSNYYTTCTNNTTTYSLIDCAASRYNHQTISELTTRGLPTAQTYSMKKFDQVELEQ